MQKMIFISSLTLLLLANTAWAKSYNHDYQDGKKTYEGYVVVNNKKAPLVFLIHDWDGINNYEKERSEMISKLGYNVFAIDLFGKGARPEKIEERKKLTQSLYNDPEKMLRLMDLGQSAAKELGLSSQNAVAIGYCFGGTAILEWAKSGRDLKGFVSFHGGLAVKDGISYKKNKAKIFIFHGSADESVSLKDFSDLAHLFEKEKIDHEMTTYGGAVHAFTNFDAPDRYNKTADKRSWERLTELLNEQLLK